MDILALSVLKTKFVAREVGDELILVPLTNNVAQMNELFTLNETAKFIWENLNENATVKGIEKLMTDAYSIDNETARNDIETFLNQLEFFFTKNQL